MACGLDAPYPPRNRALFDEMCTNGGGLVSAFPLGSPPRRQHFVARNRLLAALADAVVVVEAGLGSGSLHTAAAAREMGRALGAFPGSPGGELLLAQGAGLVTGVEDVLAGLEGRPRRPNVSLPQSGTQAALVLDALAPGAPSDPKMLAERTGLGVREVARALTGLELEGLALVLPGCTYVRSALAQELMGGVESGC
jgi:DNA processing protein